MRRCGCARCRRISAGGELGPRGSQPSGKHTPAALDRLVEALPALVEQPPRIAEPPAQSLEAVPRGAHRLGQRPPATPLQERQLGAQVLLDRHRQLGGGGRGRRAQVGDEVGDREVGLVPDGGDHRHAAGDDGARHRLLVEGPEILQRATAARDDDDVDVVDRLQAPQRRGDRQRRALSLHGRGRDQNRQRKPTVGDPDDVAHDRPLRRGHDAEPARQKRQRPLARRIEEPLGAEALLELLERQRQRAGPRRLDVGDRHLETAARFVEGQPPAAADRHPFFQRELQPRRPRARTARSRAAPRRP